MKKKLNVGLVGYGFMGRTHSNAFVHAPRFFDVPYEPVLKAVCARNADRVKAFASNWGYESIETDWRALGVPVWSWLADPATAMWAIIATTVWWVAGYYLVIYLAGLQDIPRDLYEAAAIDGAGAWHSFWAITLPLLRPVFLFVFVTHMIGSFQIFGQVFVLTVGGPGDATRTVVQHLYETAFQNFFHFGSASAMAWVLFAVILVFSVLQFRVLRGHTEY